MKRQDLHIATPRYNRVNLLSLLFQSFAELQLETLVLVGNILLKNHQSHRKVKTILKRQGASKTLLPFSSLEALRHFSLEALCPNSCLSEIPFIGLALAHSLSSLYFPLPHLTGSPLARVRNPVSQNPALVQNHVNPLAHLSKRH